VRETGPDREEYRVWLPRTLVDRLSALRRPGESYSDVILSLAEGEAG